MFLRMCFRRIESDKTTKMAKMWILRKMAKIKRLKFQKKLNNSEAKSRPCLSATKNTFKCWRLLAK